MTGISWDDGIRGGGFSINISTTTSNINFYPIVVKNTNIIFTDDELAIINKGLKYNLHHKRENWITTLPLEAETAITLLPISEQEPIRYHMANNIRKLYTQNTNYRLQHNTQANTNGNYSIKRRKK